jgi:hypothetical protein
MEYWNNGLTQHSIIPVLHYSILLLRINRLSTIDDEGVSGDKRRLVRN